MRRVALTGQSRRDFRRARKRGWDIEHLQCIMERLMHDQVLEIRSACHPLRGGYAGHWKCRIEPDFLLIWYLSGDDAIVFVRAGSHADLFGSPNASCGRRAAKRVAPRLRKALWRNPA